MAAHEAAIRRRDRRSLMALTGPAYFWLAATVFLPLAAMVYFSFLTEAPLAGKVGVFTLENYRAIWEKEFYGTLLWRSLGLGFHVTVLCVLIGFPAALILAKAVKGRWQAALLILVILPFWSNALVRIFSWAMVLRGNGVLETAVGWVADVGPLNLMFSYTAVVIGLTHSYLPYTILTAYVSLSVIDDDLIEAARSLGASWFTILRRILIPMAMPGIVAGAVLVFVPVIGSFMEPRILGGREGTFIGTVIEDQFVAVFNWPLGAALSFVMLGCVLIIFALFGPVLRRVA